MAKVPSTWFFSYKDGEIVKTSSDLYFKDKKVVLFALPGAYTPTCSDYQLPGFELDYDKFIEAGADDVCCVTVNDCFVTAAWINNLNIRKVKVLSDGNAEFTRNMGMLVQKYDKGFGMRSWRYAAIVNNGEIEWFAEEQGRDHNCVEDPYELTKPDVVLSHLLQSN